MSASLQKQMLISGITQLVIGVFCMLFGIIEKVTTPRRWRDTITAVTCLGVWMGLWIALTGVIGSIDKGQIRGNFSKAMVGVYLGFSITSTVFAGIMIICYSLTVSIWGDNRSYRESAAFVMCVLILILGTIEFGVGIWASVCCCVIGPCCGQQMAPGPVGQVVHMQTQGGPPAAYVIVQGPDGRPVAVPAQSGGPMTEMSGTPVINQTGAVGTSVPPHYQTEVQQQPPLQDQEKVPL